MNHHDTTDIEFVSKRGRDLELLKRNYGYLVTEMDDFITVLKRFVVDSNNEIAEQDLDSYLVGRLKESRSWFRAVIESENSVIRKNLDKIEGMFEAESWGVGR